MIAGIYAKAYGLHLVMVRAFNHVGPKQSPQFVVSDFCKQVAEVDVRPICYSSFPSPNSTYF